VARETPIPLPENEYLLLVGQVAYMVSYLEWLILGDLEGLRADLPAKLTLGELAGKPTGVIAERLRCAVKDIHEPDVKAYIAEGARVLKDASTRRNDLLHARPATIGGNQRLKRQVPGTEIEIEIGWLNTAIDALSKGQRALDAVRPPRS
jgi:hypothetical protein